MKDLSCLEQIKCPHCGFKNLKLTKKCTKCNYDLDFENQSCPKCGRINSNETKRCECGFNFKRRKRTLLGNVIITLVVMGLLFVLYKFKGDFIKQYDVAIKALVGFGVFVMVIKTFTSLKDEEVSYTAEEEMFEKHKPVARMKLFSNISIVVGAIAIAAFLIYYYVFR